MKKMSEKEWYEWWLNLPNLKKEKQAIVEVLVDAGLDRIHAIRITYTISRLVEVSNAYKN